MIQFLSTGLVALSLITNQFQKATHEDVFINGEQIRQLQSLQSLQPEYQYHVEVDGRFYPLEDLTAPIENKTYRVQMTRDYGERSGYDDIYLKYYTYERALGYYQDKRAEFIKKGYITEVVGQSIQGRDLLAVYPEAINPKKKTIVMFGRHHGDEGTANWIIEGFVNEFLKDGIQDWHNRYQLILFPMVNPDGAVAQRRYNARSRDLNRWWNVNKDYSKEAYEVAQIHSYLDQLLDSVESEVVIALDMHGSFTEDFIYRVSKNYKSADFYNHQQKFIDQLATYDPYQNGNFQLSNGDPGMARIVMINGYAFNALTHETPRDIRIDNKQNRSLETLKAQGRGVYQSIWDRY